MRIWELIRKFMRDTEIASNIQFANSAWDRAKQLERDLIDYVGVIEEQHREFTVGYLTEIESLRNFVTTMREAVHDAETDHHLSANWTTDRIQKALKRLNDEAEKQTGQDSA